MIPGPKCHEQDSTDRRKENGGHCSSRLAHSRVTRLRLSLALSALAYSRARLRLLVSQPPLASISRSSFSLYLSPILVGCCPTQIDILVSISYCEPQGSFSIWTILRVFLMSTSRPPCWIIGKCAPLDLSHDPAWLAAPLTYQNPLDGSMSS